MDKFTKPTVIDDVTLAFPANVVKDLMPAYADIPAQFRPGSGGNTMWNRFQSDWFYGGIQVSRMIPKPGIDKNVALRHLKAINGSYEPKHEHKEAAVAYLASLWFTEESVWTAREE